MITSKIKRRIVGKGCGAVFSPVDFLDIGSRASVDQTLSRLAAQGIIRRLTRGLYDYPKVSDRFGQLSPSLDDVAHAVARKDNQVRQVSASQVRNFARALGNLAKIDPLDARMIARFIAFRPEAGRRLFAEILRKLNTLTTKRRQLVMIKKRLSCQIKQRGSEELENLDQAHMALLINQICYA